MGRGCDDFSFSLVIVEGEEGGEKDMCTSASI